MIISEWFRKPISKLDLSLRFPYFYHYVFVSSLFLLLTSAFILTLIYELIALKPWYEKKLVPAHLKNFSDAKHLFIKRKDMNIKQLFSITSKITKLSSWSTIYFFYMALSSWGWEIIFKLLYPLLVKSNISYQTLLIGFSNESTKSDQLLWNIAHEKNKDLKDSLLEEFLEKYGSRNDDVDLANPTLREKPESIKKLISLYQNLPSPEKILAQSKSKRQKAAKEIMQSLRVPKRIFQFLLSKTQQNVALREDRRLYEFQFTYFIRQLIFELANRLDISQDKIFNLSWRQIKHEANKRHSR